MSKHTPGPWKVYDPQREHETFGIDSASGFAVVWYGNRSDEGIRRIEDARLIAAAPELLEELSLMVQQFAQYVPAAPNGGNEAWRISKARAAIAKATGGQQ